MFRSGTQYHWADGRESVIEVQSVGELSLPTGGLVAQDPGWGTRPEVQPFIVTVPPGRYPVDLSVSQWGRSPDPCGPHPLRLVNAARLNVRPEPPVSWEPALQLGQAGVSLENDSIPGLSVDSGTACFLDAAARNQLEYKSQGVRSDLEDAMVQVADVGGLEVGTDDPDFNIIVFKCGMGDGMYLTWIGRSESGNVVSFVVDLELLQHSLDFNVGTY